LFRPRNQIFLRDAKDCEETGFPLGAVSARFKQIAATDLLS